MAILRECLMAVRLMTDEFAALELAYGQSESNVDERIEMSVRLEEGGDMTRRGEELGTERTYAKKQAVVASPAYRQKH